MPEAKEVFYVGGRYYETAAEVVMSGHAYIQHHSPDRTTQPHPVVMIHGGHQMGVNFETTPDGRPGWLRNFLDEGYDVYLMDQPGRGRSPYVYELYGNPGLPYATQRYMERTTLAAKYRLWPEAHLHTQWPGSGEPGDHAFDQFYASQSPYIDNKELREQLVRRAGTELLERIGPAILVTHSQSGHFGWHLADERPDLVKAIVAVEPGGPPFEELDTIGPPEYYRVKGIARPFGITATALTYDPPLDDDEGSLPSATEGCAEPWSKVNCVLQPEPARRLVNVAKVPVWVLTAEASYHAGFDHCTVKFLRQAGVDVTHVRLRDHGVVGNGHMMMLEENSAEIAAVIQGLLRDKGLAIG